MTQIKFKRVMGRIWRVAQVADPKGNAMALEKIWFKREVFSSIVYLGFGFCWYHRCVNDQQTFLI